MTQPSPLAEASPASLQELFDRDPLQLTDPDIERIVTELRAQRQRWEAGQKSSKSKMQQVVLSLDDLGV